MRPTLPQGKLTASEWAVFTGSAPAGRHPPASEGATPGDSALGARPPWLPEEAWRGACDAAAAVPALAALPASLREGVGEWRAAVGAAGRALPGAWRRLPDLQRLLVLKCLRSAPPSPLTLLLPFAIPRCNYSNQGPE